MGMISQKRNRERDSKKCRRIKILLADDHKIFRSGLHELLEQVPLLEVVGEAGNGRTATQLCAKLSPDVVIMDISMPDLNGIEATRLIARDSPKTKVIILSIHKDQRYVAEVFKAGASAYLLKDCDFHELISAIRAVSDGGTFLSPQIATVVRDGYIQGLLNAEDSSSSPLTLREREVLQLVAEGRSTKEIAFSFSVSIKTIEAHRKRIMEKLDIHSVAELTKYAIREGLTSLES
jgi:DNA-binding NarL/FixJ family response regulator